jgi:hypothetical protein
VPCLPGFLPRKKAFGRLFDVLGFVPSYEAGMTPASTQKWGNIAQIVSACAGIISSTAAIAAVTLCLASDFFVKWAIRVEH